MNYIKTIYGYLLTFMITFLFLMTCFTIGLIIIFAIVSFVSWDLIFPVLPGILFAFRVAIVISALIGIFFAFSKEGREFREQVKLDRKFKKALKEKDIKND